MVLLGGRGEERPLNTLGHHTPPWAFGPHAQWQSDRERERLRGGIKFKNRQTWTERDRWKCVLIYTPKSKKQATIQIYNY